MAMSVSELRRQLAALTAERHRKVDELAGALVAIDSITDRMDVLLERLEELKAAEG